MVRGSMIFILHSAEDGIGSDMYAWNQAVFEGLSSLNQDKIGWDDKFLRTM